jgi:hypothetical protein
MTSAPNADRRPLGNRPLIRKWYFSLSEASINRKDHGWRALTRVAVTSALSNTSLHPCMLYDGEEGEFTAEIRAMGATVITHRVSFHDHLAQAAPARTADYLGIARGAFLRVEIPLIEREDDFVLFTDCDVMFLADPRIEAAPALFAAAPQATQTAYDIDMNTGVMVMNVPALRATLPHFIAFIIKHLPDGWPGFDQENYRRFYKGQWDKLDNTFNWKPYWGRNPSATIVHWHGPKPQIVRRLLHDGTLETHAVWRALFERDIDGYREFLRIWDTFAEKTPRDILGHLDYLTARGVGGWAICPDDPLRPVHLTIVIDGNVHGVVACDARRPDIKTAYGIEAAGFSFQLPPMVDDDRPHKLQFLDEMGRPVFLKRGRDTHQQHWHLESEKLTV